MQRRASGLTLLLALGLTGGMGGWLWHWARISTLGEMETQVDTWMPVWIGIRWWLLGLMALTILFQAHRPQYPGPARAVPGRSALGWRMVLWLCTLELVVGQALQARGMASVMGG